MNVETVDEILAYWLIPAKPAAKYFRALIRELAERFDAPVFEPHVTIHTTTAATENAVDTMRQALANVGALWLSITGIDSSEEFTKTLFIQFRPDKTLTLLNEKLRAASVSQSEYQLNPHLSLIYRRMSPETKTQIAPSIHIPFTDVRFDSVKAVISPAEIKSRADVEAWRVVATQQLAG